MDIILTIGIVFIVLWLVGFVAFPLIGGFIHVLIVIAIIMFLLRVIRGK